MHEYRFPRQKKTDRNHYAAMDYAQVPNFMRVLRQKQVRSTGASALEFVILTACRTGEALGAQWSEFDFENRVWTLKPERTKQARAHTVPLSDRAMELLTLQRQYANGSPYVFTGYFGTKVDDKIMRACCCP